MSKIADDGTLKLTWEDLLIESVDPERARDWFELWEISGRIRLVFLNKFGWIFFERAEGPVDMLDTFEGTFERIAESIDEFRGEVNRGRWQEVYLLSLHVYRLHQAGIVPDEGECYALTPHPLRGGLAITGDGPLALDRVRVMDVGEWQSLCAEAWRKPAH
jgi:hypothetical protein